MIAALLAAAFASGKYGALSKSLGLHFGGARGGLTTSPSPSLWPKESLDRFDGVKKTSWLRGKRDEIMSQIELARPLVFCVHSYDRAYL
jgi:hypothetical protein